MGGLGDLCLAGRVALTMRDASSERGSTGRGAISTGSGTISAGRGTVSTGRGNVSAGRGARPAKRPFSLTCTLACALMCLAIASERITLPHVEQLTILFFPIFNNYSLIMLT
jgi:hypothetical protein